MEEEAQEEPYAKQVASRSFGCSLFGCNQLKQIHGQYCCHNHEILSYVLSFGKVAYTVVDGFFDNDIEKNLKIGIALLKSVQNIDVGIPWIADLDDEDHVLAEGEDPTSIFHKVPWNLGFIDCGFLDYELQRSWLFFHPTSLPRFETFEFEGALFRWDRKNRFVQTYLAESEEPLLIPSSVAYLREEVDDIEEVKMEGIEFWREGWTLSEHILHNRSLFCLTYKSNEEDTLFRRKRGKLDTKRKESQIQCSSGPPKKKRKETHVKSCSAGKQTTTVGVLPMASGNLISVAKVHKIQETETCWSEMKVWMIDQICNDSGVSQGEALFYLEGFKWDLDVAMEACRNKTLLPVKKTSSLGGLVTEEPTAEPMVISSGRNQILPNSPEQQPHLDNKLINSFREAT
ncbi:unnamed protein product [Arabis nemorensis]|uniref:Uncharacterized protein n=1 Tax=Arabis nemorensis TaxID=586526 RepID=A0A565BF67_9BRAS|nr:unnamed protein product [Arabis nemorensis]